MVKIVGTGVCGTDRKILLGRFPARPGVVLGHESVGVVQEAGPGMRSVGVGDRVVVNPTLDIEPLACVLNNVQAAALTFDDTVAVLGAGPIGMLTVLVSARQARRVVVAERDDYRLTAARDAFEYVADVSGGYRHRRRRRGRRAGPQWPGPHGDGALERAAGAG